MTCCPQTFKIVHLDAVDPLHGDDVASRAFPVDPRHTKSRIVLGVFGKFGQGCRLEAQIHLDLGRLRQTLCNFDRPQPAGRRHEPFLHARCEEEAFQIVGEAATHAWPDHFDRNLVLACLAPDGGRMNLRNRRSSDWIIEAGIKLTDRPAKRIGNCCRCLRGRERRHAVLKVSQFGSNVRSHHIGTRRQKLSQLDIRRPETVDGARHAQRRI